MVSINDDPDLQTLFVHQCGLTCIDITELKGGIKVSHLEKLFPYLEKHIDTRHNQSCRDFPGGRKSSCKSVTRNELKRLLRAKDKGKDGTLSMEEFCQFLSELDDGVKEKCENADLVTKVSKIIQSFNHIVQCIKLHNTKQYDRNISMFLFFKTWTELAHAGVYTCWPPPLFIPFAILLQIIVFVGHQKYYSDNFGRLCNLFII